MKSARELIFLKGKKKILTWQQLHLRLLQLIEAESHFDNNLKVLFNCESRVWYFFEQQILFSVNFYQN